jgi:hypothetical protein
VFEEYTNKAWGEEIVNELVGVTKVEPMSASGEPMPVDELASVGSESSTADDPGEFIASEEFPAITFYPDGTCDSAEVVLASRNTEDERRLAVRLGGMLGTVTTRTISTSEGEEIDPDAAAFEEFNELYESSVPVSETSYSDYSAAPAAAGYGN